jgi:hypothetical protein
MCCTHQQECTKSDNASLKSYLSLANDASVKTLDDGTATTSERYRRLQPVESVDIGAAMAFPEPNVRYCDTPAKMSCSASSGKLALVFVNVVRI